MPEELKLDAETSQALEAMRKEAPIEENATEQLPVPEKEEDKPEVKNEAKTEAEHHEKTVPLAALQETREELKAERRKNEEIQRRTDERLKLITEAFQKPAQTAEIQIPDPERDALGALKMNQQQLRELSEFKQNYEMKQAQDIQRQHLMSEAARLESEFMKSTADYLEASQFLSNSRRNELMATGIYTPQQVNQILGTEAQALAHQAISNNRNPAETVYAIAKARGYAQKLAVKASEETETQKISRIAQGQDASKSLGQAQGAQISSGSKLDGKALANMSDDDFAKLYSKLSRGDRMALMGN